MPNIASQIWSDPKFLAIEGDFGKLLFIHLCTREQVLPGIIKAGPAGIAESIQREDEPAMVRSAFYNLVELNLVEYDGVLRLTRVPKAPTYNPPYNGNQLRGWYRKWVQLPDSKMRTDHVESILAPVTRLLEASELARTEGRRKEKREHWEEVWGETFGLVRPLYSGRRLSLVSDNLNGSRNDSANGSVIHSLNGRGNHTGNAVLPLDHDHEDQDPERESDDLVVPDEHAVAAVAAAAAGLPVTGDPVERLWNLQHKYRTEASVGRAKRLPLTKRARAMVEDILRSYSEADCEHVLAVLLSEATQKRTIQFMDGVTNWKPVNFARTFGREVETGRDVRRGAAPPAKPDAFGKAPRKADLR
jgi:hypothetical protein